MTSPRLFPFGWVGLAALGACAHAGPAAAPAPDLDAALAPLTRALATGDGARVAVLPFIERGVGPTQLGEYVGDKVVVQLANLGSVNLVERTRLLDATWDELCRSARGEISDATAKTIGERLGADVVIVGILTDLSARWELSARALDTETARVVAATDVDLPASELPANLAGRASRGRTEGCGPAEAGSGAGDEVAGGASPGSGGTDQAELRLGKGEGLRLFRGASNRHELQDPRFSVDVRNRSYVKNPWVVAEGELRGLAVEPGARVFLAGREDGRAPVKADRLLLVEIAPRGDGVARRVFVGMLPSGRKLSVQGGDPERLGDTRNAVQFGPGELDLTTLLPEGPFDLRVWALSYRVGGWVSDVFLVAR